MAFAVPIVDALSQKVDRMPLKCTVRDRCWRELRGEGAVVTDQLAARGRAARHGATGSIVNFTEGSYEEFKLTLSTIFLNLMRSCFHDLFKSELRQG